MIDFIPSHSIGHVSHGWLAAKHHFSFGSYYNPNRIGFGKIRVINDDCILPQTGFDMHGHTNMEIITFVRSGAITHTDSQGNKGRTEAGSIQVMSAGSGIRHSEFNMESVATTIYQIWIEPKELDIAPRFDAHVFPAEYVTGNLPILVSGEYDAPLYIHQLASIYGGKVRQNERITHPLSQNAYVLISKGSICLNTTDASAGDAFALRLAPCVDFIATEDAEVLIITTP